MKLKLDENLGRRWAEQLRDAGHEVHTIWDEQLSGASDAEVLVAAVNETRALVPIPAASWFSDFATEPDGTTSMRSLTASDAHSKVKVRIRPATFGSSTGTACDSTRNQPTDRRSSPSLV